MNTESTHAKQLAALGHEARLRVFHLLVAAGHDGLTVGQIGQHTGLAASTLAHHLRALVESGLVVQERLGREVTSRVAFDAMHALVSYLTSECCKGVVLTEDETAA